MFETSKIEISRSALVNNIQFIKKLIGDKCILSSVVKGNAYGHGIEQFIPIAEAAGINHFSVFSTDEAYRAKKVVQDSSTILIMGMLDFEQLEWAILNDIEFYVFDLKRLENAIKIAQKLKKLAIVHIEVETGMNRTGLTNGDLKKAVKLIKDNANHLFVKGLCTHYAGAESIANYLRVKNQLKTFKRTQKWLIKNGITPSLFHTACSAATVRYPDTQMDMVRIGIMQYGFWPSKETFITYLNSTKEKIDPLKRIISWKSQIMNITKVKTGEFVGYGTTYMAEYDMSIGTIPIGYSHGYSRSLSNQGRVLINETRVGVIGMINMNMLLVDITNVPNCQPGDTVTLIGNEGDLSISVSSFSELSSQLNYESLTRLPHSIPRKVVA